MNAKVKKQSRVFLEHYDLQKYEEAVRTVPCMFECLNSHTGSPATLKQNIFQIVLKHGKVTIKEAWAIAYSFLDLVTDQEFLAKMKG